ncbi:hypothetical protein SNEBB_007848 [Seison nebaliae]|nr:hypothetical protein SNEBB_007848 [Seison nebaliae]
MEYGDDNVQRRKTLEERLLLINERISETSSMKAEFQKKSENERTSISYAINELICALHEREKSIWKDLNLVTNQNCRKFDDDFPLLMKAKEKIEKILKTNDRSMNTYQILNESDKLIQLSEIHIDISNMKQLKTSFKKFGKVSLEEIDISSPGNGMVNQKNLFFISFDQTPKKKAPTGLAAPKWGKVQSPEPVVQESFDISKFRRTSAEIREGMRTKRKPKTKTTSKVATTTTVALTDLKRSGTFIKDAVNDQLKLPNINLDEEKERKNEEEDDGEIGEELKDPNSPKHAEYLSTLGKQVLTYRNRRRIKRILMNEINGEMKLNKPNGITISPTSNGAVAICDSGNHQVVIIQQKSGRCVKCIKPFRAPFGICSTENGDYIISDNEANTVSIFDRFGQFVRLIANVKYKFSSPTAIAYDIRTELIYICDKGNHRIQIYTINGNYVSQFGRKGTKHGNLSSPTYLALSQQHERLYVSDTFNHRIEVFDLKGEFMFSIGEKGTKFGQLRYPRGIAVDVNGNIVVVDSGNFRLQVFKNDGVYVTSVLQNLPSLQFEDLEDVLITSGYNILVSDHSLNRVQII